VEAEEYFTIYIKIIMRNLLGEKIKRNEGDKEKSF
jgi:hypothetical protein